jgi:hypothetical protein
MNNEIIIVASWKVSIPPKWYGAVEDIIWNYKIFLEKYWYKIKIVNTKNIFKLIKETVFVNKKIIHFHYEPYLIISYMLNKLFLKNNRILWTSHNWYIVWEKESIFYKIIAKIISFFSDTIMISLSKKMEDYFIKKWFKWKKYILENGINTNNFKKINKPHKDIIYLWNINKNKWQKLFIKYFNLKNKIDFVWPYLDKSINLKWNNYLWIWTKKEVFEKLWEYKVLVLLTKSEWDPLVIKEALSAWCCILTSQIWWINLGKNKEFIKIIDIKNKKELKNINNYLIELLQNNQKYREEIFNYSKNFDWKNIVNRYVNLLNKL